jgi:hypothetical protein
VHREKLVVYIRCMIDFETLIASLQRYGFHVEHVYDVPSNAGEAELMVDGKLLPLSEVRALLAAAEARSQQR